MSIWADEQGKEEYGPLDAISVSHMSARNGVLLLTDRTQLDGACHIIAYYNKCCRSRYSVRSYSELAQDR